jgi:hypothetical protein
MRKILLIAVFSYAIGCNSPESEVTNTDSTLNTPPRAADDTSGGSRFDSTHTADTLGTGVGAGRTGPEGQ